MKGILKVGTFCLLFTFTLHARGLKVCFEAETAKTLESPMGVVSNGIEGASGTYLEIPEGAGNPPKLQSGKATFEIEIPEQGNYTLWCRVWWEGECSNSFTLQFDDQPACLFGEDATYRAWHWVKYPLSRTARRITLTQGKHTLTLLNREDGIRIDQILLSTDTRFVPIEIEQIGTRR